MSLTVLSVLFPRNVSGFQTGGYTGSHYNDAPQGNRTTHPTYEDPYPRPPTSPRVQPGMPMGYGTSQRQASQQPPMGETVPLWSVSPANFPLPPGVAGQQSPRPMSASWSPFQGPAGAHNALGGSYPPSANESHFPYNTGGFVGQQNPPPMSPPRSQFQGSVGGDWNAMAGSSSYPGQSANGSYSPHPPAGFFEQNPRAMPTASPYRGPAGVQVPYP